MSQSRPNESFISNINGGNQDGEDGSTSPTEYVVHEITIIGNWPTATSTNSNAIDTVDQRMLLMDKDNGLKNIIEKLQVSTDEQIFPEVKSDDEYINSENNTARSSISSSRSPMQSSQNDSNENILNENQWTMKLSNPIFIEKLFDSENDMKSSDNDDQGKEIGGADIVVTMQFSIDDTGELEIEGEKFDRKIEEKSMDNTIQKSIENEIEKQLNEESPTDELNEYQFSIQNGNDSGQSKEENKFTTLTNTKNGFKKSTINDVEMPDAVMDLILNSLLDDCTRIEKYKNDASSDKIENSQIEHESVELALQSILKAKELCFDDQEILIAESFSSNQISITPDISTDYEECEAAAFNNSIRSIPNELNIDSGELSKYGNGCDEIEREESSNIDAATAVAESTVNEIIENLQLEQASVDLAMESILQNENITKDNVTTKSDSEKSEYARNIADDEIDTSKSIAIEIAIENPPLKQTITEEIDSDVKILVKSDEIEKNTSSTNVSVNGLKDEPKDDKTDNAAIDGSIAAFLPFSDVDAILSPSETSNGHTTPTQVAERVHAEENIHRIVHEIMASVDELFERVF